MYINNIEDLSCMPPCSLPTNSMLVFNPLYPFHPPACLSGYFPLQSEYCLVWICLDVLFCTASIMHLCTISIDRYLSLSYPMRFGRNKTRTRITVKITIVWLLSIAMSLPLSLMYSQVLYTHTSVVVAHLCSSPDKTSSLCQMSFQPHGDSLNVEVMFYERETFDHGQVHLLCAIYNSEGSFN